MASERKPIYLDYHATTPVDPVVLEAMIPYFSIEFGNPASRSHSYGWKAAEAVDLARQQVAGLLEVSSLDIFFTSGSTEGLNMAIKGLADAKQGLGRHIITVSTEHHAVLDPLKWLQKKGYEVTHLPVDANGLIDQDDFVKVIRKDTLMVVVMWANNETGVIHPMHDIGRICAEKGVTLVSDITQAAGKISAHPAKARVGIACLSAHKMYGPKGVGAIFIDQSGVRVKPSALIHGGGHEQGFRSGTLNVPGIVGLGMAAKLQSDRMEQEMIRLKDWRNEFERTIQAEIAEVTVNGGEADRLATVSNFSIKFVDSQAVMTRFRSKLAISSGSACSSADPEPSHVLLAMGLSLPRAKGSFRVSMGIPTTREEWTESIALLKAAIEEERAINPVWNMHQRGLDVSEFA